MIDLKHKYALLSDGTIEPLHYYDGEPRDAYQDRNGIFYMDYDVFDQERFSLQYKHSRIIRTSNKRHELEVLINGKTT